MPVKPLFHAFILAWVSSLANCPHRHLDPIVPLAKPTQKPTGETYTKNVPADTGSALINVGVRPLQKPIAPSAANTCLAQSMLLL